MEGSEGGDRGAGTWQRRANRNWKDARKYLSSDRFWCKTVSARETPCDKEEDVVGVIGTDQDVQRPDVAVENYL